MKILPRILSAFCTLALSSSLTSAATVADLAKAQVIISKIEQVAQKYRELTIELEAPAALGSSKGKYLVPFTKEGQLTEWADEALNAQAGAAAGEQAGKALGRALASKVPLCGLAAGGAKKKGKQMGAAAAIGGMKFIKETMENSLNNVDDYTEYLHVEYSDHPDYQKGLASAMALHPEMEGRTDFAMSNAYKKAAKAARKKK